MKITAIMGGGDWDDASVDFVILPEGPGIQGLNLKYQEWYKGYQSGRDKFYSFPEWLKEFAGAVPTSNDQLEEFWEV